MEKSEKSYYESLYEVAAALNSARGPEAVLYSIVKNTRPSGGAYFRMAHSLILCYMAFDCTIVQIVQSAIKRLGVLTQPLQ